MNSRSHRRPTVGRFLPPPSRPIRSHWRQSFFTANYPLRIKRLAITRSTAKSPVSSPAR
ncbi:hypothetical protein HMPREF1556_01577 [Porphyromonas sp. oral taxon 278 str. W7784]|nr:hypothetical protein HMPREF1556_01577 [Porphyromonas sp. oral taxon 278 str. W7784]